MKDWNIPSWGWTPVRTNSSTVTARSLLTVNQAQRGFMSVSTLTFERDRALLCGRGCDWTTPAACLPFTRPATRLLAAMSGALLPSLRVGQRLRRPHSPNQLLATSTEPSNMHRLGRDPLLILTDSLGNLCKR